MPQEPTSVDQFNWLIHLQHIRGESLACKDLIKMELARSCGRNEYAYYKQGVILREEKRIQEALESFQACLRLNPQSPTNIKEVAGCLYELRRFRLALEAYIEAEQASQNPDWEIYHGIGNCYLRLGDLSSAKDFARKAVSIGKQELSYSLLMKILTMEGDYKAAVEVCNAAIESCPDSVDMLSESGLLFLKVGHSQLAFERLGSALALEPSCVKALLGIGCITQSHEDHDVALSKYKIAVQSQPDSVALWNNIGICFHSKQKYIAAISCLKRALWISPLNWKVLFNLGLVHLSTFQPASAFNFACAAVNLRPEAPEFFCLLGCALLELQDPENALRAMRQAVLISPEDPQAVANAALCSFRLGLQEQGSQLLQHFDSLIGDGQEGAIRPEVTELVNSLKRFVLAPENEQNIQMSTEEQSVNQNDNTAEGIEETLVDEPPPNYEDVVNETGSEQYTRTLMADEV